MLICLRSRRCLLSACDVGDERSDRSVLAGAPGRFLGSDALFDEVAIRGRGEIDPDPEEPVEGAVHVATSVPAEHELVEIALDVALPETVEGLCCAKAG